MSLIKQLFDLKINYSNLAKLTFLFYLFFVFFGTELPFSREGGIRETIEITSNPARQIIFGSLFFTSFISILPQRKKYLFFLEEVKFFSIFFIWCTSTILWSNSPEISIKRLFQFYISIQIIISILLYIKDPKELLFFLQIVLGLYIIVTILTLFFITEARGYGGGWKGIALTKNNLGQVTFISSILWLISFFYTNSSLKKFIYAIFLTCSLVLLAGSYSSTSLLTFIILITLGFIFYGSKIFISVGLKNKVSFLFLMFLIIISLLIFLSDTYLLAQLLREIGKEGKDLTLTGRTYLWSYILNIARPYIFIGCGFQGFWIGEAKYLNLLYDYIGWVPNQAHNGYIDLINEIGIVGFILFLTIIFDYFRKLLSLSKYLLSAQWLFIGALIINITESSFIRAHTTVGVIFWLIYFIKKFNMIKWNYYYSSSNK